MTDEATRREMGTVLYRKAHRYMKAREAPKKPMTWAYWVLIVLALLVGVIIGYDYGRDKGPD